jgi:hypothetical protein
LNQSLKNFAKRLLGWRKIVPPYVRLFDPAASDAAFYWRPHRPPPGQPQFVIVSPHLDDAPLSLGGHMLQWGRRCIVLDLFSTVSWWRFAIESHEDPRIQLSRDAEEDLVAELTGATIRRVGLMEAPRRGYRLDDIFTAEIVPTEAAGKTMQCPITSLAAEGSFRWYLPLAVGNHVDHRITRDSALPALLAAGVTPDRIRFFEDLFYSAQTPGIHDFSHFVPGRRLLLAEQTTIDLKRKISLLHVYYSQLNESQIKSVGDYAMRFGNRAVERLWKLA